MGCQTRRVTFGVPFLCLLLLASGGWMAVASRQTGAGAGQRTDPATTRSSVPQNSSFSNDPNLSSGPSLGPGNAEGSSTPNFALGSPELFFKMMLSVGLVVGLGGAALYVSKRVLPRVAQSGGKEIHILETACLGPHKALHLVEVGAQRLLIASTSDHITMLTTVNEPWLDLPRAETAEAVKA